MYTKNNCKYECHVELAHEKCHCIPWDFVHNTEAEECDVFGRMCFYDSISNYTKYPINLCPHCIKACDITKYRKTTTKSVPLYKGLNVFTRQGNYKYVNINCKAHFCGNCTGSKAFCNFMMDTNHTLIDIGYKTLINNQGDRNYFKKLRMDLQRHMIIIHLKFVQPEMYIIDTRYSLMDKIANFGGNFGIFAEITGCSFLGILNLFILAMKFLFTKRN